MPAVRAMLLQKIPVCHAHVGKPPWRACTRVASSEIVPQLWKRIMVTALKVGVIDSPSKGHVELEIMRDFSSNKSVVGKWRFGMSQHGSVS